MWATKAMSLVSVMPNSSIRTIQRHVQVYSDKMPKEVSASFQVVGIWKCEDS
jgi:hypothetical protein